MKPEGGIAVNLYTNSTAHISFDDGTQVDIEQITNYPNSGGIAVNLTLNKPRGFPLSLRIPRFAKNVSIKVNGLPANGNIASGEFFVINRTWNTGDKVEIDIPLEIRLVAGRKRQYGRTAVMRGPLVYTMNRAANPGINSRANLQGLGKMTLDPTSLGFTTDTTVRADGTACTVGAWNPGFYDNTGRHDLELKLTEFADPDGIVTYFRVLAYSDEYTVPDELFEITPE
jgi:DUF1680 family protein